MLNDEANMSRTCQVILQVQPGRQSWGCQWRWHTSGILGTCGWLSKHCCAQEEYLLASGAAHLPPGIQVMIRFLKHRENGKLGTVCQSSCLSSEPPCLSWASETVLTFLTYIVKFQQILSCKMLDQWEAKILLQQILQPLKSSNPFKNSAIAVDQMASSSNTG